MNLKHGLLVVALLCSLSLTVRATELVVNGGFETGDFTGWTTAPISFPMYVDSNAHSGDFGAQIAGYSWGPDSLLQTVSTTVGQDYTLSFWREVFGGDPTKSLVLNWDGNAVFSELNSGAFPYQQFSFNVVGTGSDTIQFLCINDPSFTYVDDVSLTPSSLSVPDSGATVAMLGGAILVLAAMRRRLACA